MMASMLKHAKGNGDPFLVVPSLGDGVTRRDRTDEVALDVVDAGDTRLATGERGGGPTLGGLGDRGLRDDDATLEVVDNLCNDALASDAVLNELDASLAVETLDIGRSFSAGGCRLEEVVVVPALLLRIVDARDRTDVTDDAEDCTLVLFSATDWVRLG